MVSSGTVTSDASKLKSSLKSCNSSISGLSGSWEGASFDNLESKFESFYGTTLTIDRDMESFAAALDLYEKYKEIKSEIKSLKSQISSCGEDETVRKSMLLSKCERNERDLENLAKQIRDRLSSIKGSGNLKGMFDGAVGTIKDSFDTEETSSDILGSTSSNIVEKDGNMVLNTDLDKIVDTFGGQADSKGPYPYDRVGCDNYARGYCLYAQTGQVANYADVGTGGLGLTKTTVMGKNRKNQAEIVYERLKNEGKPSVIHVNSDSGNGHWMCVVGYKKGATKESVTIGDLIVIDSAGNWGGSNSAKIRPCSENKTYCSEGTDRCYYEPGYHVIYYDK